MAFGLVTLLSPGQAAQVSLGLQTGVATAAPAGKGALIGLGAHMTLSTPINAARDLQVRGNLEGNLQLNGVPNILLDVTLIKQRAGMYYGGGIGSGVSFDFADYGSGLPFIILSPEFLANIHGVVGTTLSNGTVVEGLFRLGAAPRLEARVSFPLR